MKTASKHLPPLRLPGVLQTESQSELLEILAASLLASHMLWPEAAEERSRSLYMTLALRKIHDLLLETQKEHAHAVFTAIVEKYFGGWQQYSQNLILVNFPSQGKGSISERSWQGEVAGMLFLYVMRNEVSLNEAAKAISEESIQCRKRGSFGRPIQACSGKYHEELLATLSTYCPLLGHLALFCSARSD